MIINNLKGKVTEIVKKCDNMVTFVLDEATSEEVILVAMKTDCADFKEIQKGKKYKVTVSLKGVKKHKVTTSRVFVNNFLFVKGFEEIAD
jgi:ABC-type microcin C transport system permease subunit YejB